MSRILALLLSTVFLLLTACQSPPSGEKRVFHYNLPNNVTSLDPAFAKNRNNIWVVDHLYSTLVQFDDQMKIIPDIAESWSVSDDGLRYTFKLKSGIAFHESEIFPDTTRFVTSSDVEYSLNRLLDENVKSPGSWVLAGRLDTTKPFESPSPDTFVLNLLEPFPPMLGILTMQYCSVVSRKAVELYGDNFRKQPIGTGPFKLIKWRENEGLFMERNPNYHLQADCNLDGIRVSFISDRKTSLLEMLSGKLHFQSGIDPTYKAILLDSDGQIQERHRDAIELTKAPYLNTEYLGVNLELAQQQSHPLSQVSFRKALNYAIDREEMIRSLRSGFGRPAVNGFIPYGMNAFNHSQVGYASNRDSASYYLSHSDYDNEEIVIYTNQDYLDISLFCSNAWAKIGVNSRVELLESSLLRERMRKGELLLFRASWIGDYPDDETFLTVFYGENPAPPNYTRFRNLKFDSLYHEAMSISDQESRREIYQKMNQVIIDEAPVIFLFYDETMLLSSRKVSGISKNAFNLLRTDSLKLLR